MGDGVQMLVSTSMMHQIQYTQTADEIDNLDLLPTDDQLDKLVDSLCESFPTLKLKLDLNENVNAPIQENTDVTSVQEPVINEPVYSDARANGNTSYDSSKLQRGLKGGNAAHVIRTSCSSFGESHIDFKFTRAPVERRSSSNSCLNVAIMQCTSSLEQLTEKRKNLELLVQVQHNAVNNNYNFSYTPRLPDTPTRVDRLIYDVSQERCRILGLMSTLEKTVDSFASKTAKDNMRQLLIDFGKAIIEVIKERQSEINYSTNGADYENRVFKLVRLIDEVNRYTRQVNSALWCLEVKEQMNMVMSQKRPLNQPRRVSAEQRNCGVGVLTFQNSWQMTKPPQHQKQFQQRGQKMPQSPKMFRTYNGCGQLPKKGRLYQGCIGVVQHQQTNIYQVVPSPKERKSSAMQLYAQQQRAEIFQRYSSSLKNNRNSGLK